MEQLKNYSSSSTMCMSEDVRALIDALIEAKRHFKKICMSGNNTHLRIKYAKIDDIFNAVEPALLDQGIAIVHFRRLDGEHDSKKEILLTRLIHKLTGQWIEDECFLESEKPGNQAKGAALTYMRKAAVLNLCGLCPDDDDGEDEQSYTREKNISSEQLKEINTLMGSLADEQYAKVKSNICKFNKITDLSKLKLSTFDRIKAYILKEKEAKT